MTRPRGPRPLETASVTLALFLAVFVLLAFQLRSGRDPALGSPQVPASAPAPPPKRILVRKIIVTRVVVHVPAADHAPSAAQAVSAAPVASRPAPAAAAAPAAPPVTSAPRAVTAPPPPPLTTRSS